MFRDRVEAGRLLAERLSHLKDAPLPVVLGLPRGGVVVAGEIARALNAPLDVLIVRKLGAPYQPELAIGAVTNGDNPQTVLNQDIISALGVSETYLEEETARQLVEVLHRQEAFRRGRDPVKISGRTVIVADDGIATGATVRAGLSGLRRSRPQRLILAIPVAPADTVERIEHEVDELICLHAPASFTAVGRFYSDFAQVTDEEVIALLEEASARVET